MTNLGAYCDHCEYEMALDKFSADPRTNPATADWPTWR